MVSLNSGDCNCSLKLVCSCEEDCACEDCGCEECGISNQCACGGNCACNTTIVEDSSD